MEDLVRLPEGEGNVKKEVGRMLINGISTTIIDIGGGLHF
jgi:hypothetical protein